MIMKRTGWDYFALVAVGAFIAYVIFVLIMAFAVSS